MNVVILCLHDGGHFITLQLCLCLCLCRHFPPLSESIECLTLSHTTIETIFTTVNFTNQFYYIFHVGESTSNMCQKRSAFTPQYAPTCSFLEIAVSPTMGSDHLPDRYLAETARIRDSWIERQCESKL